MYYANYEDTFYHLDVDFPVEKMKEMVRRAYAMNYVSVPPSSLQEYIVTNKNLSFDSYNNPYDGFSDLVFGFAPKGMVVVWLWYGITAVEVGRYQAQIIKDDKELEQKEKKSAENGISLMLLLRNGMTTVPATTGDLFYPQKITLLLWLNIELGIIMGKKILCFVLGYYRQKTESGQFQKKYSFFGEWEMRSMKGVYFSNGIKWTRYSKRKAKLKTIFAFILTRIIR